MNKTAIKNFAMLARKKLIADITYKAGLLGISEKEIKPALAQSSADAQFFDIGSKEPYRISGAEIAQRKHLAGLIESRAKQSDYKTAYNAVIEEVAYTWFNRLIAVRFMEVNDYLPSRIRVLSSESGKAEPDLVTTPFDSDLQFSAQERELVLSLKNDNKLDELFRLLFIKQCNALCGILPELFEKTNDYSELLLNISFTDKDGVVRHLVDDVAEDDFKEAVEIIGWMYQYYNTDPKQEVFDNLKKNIKITKEKIPAATQLFTPEWIVRYMVENSLGRLFVVGSGKWGVISEEERIAKEKEIADKFSWKYYIPEAEQTPEVRSQLTATHSSLPTEFHIENVKFIDPCMGSGHILVYAFDVLIQIYESAGYTQRDAAKLILEKNLYGLDIDRRAYQLAYFSLMMKARSYNRRALDGSIVPQVYHPAGFAAGEDFGSLLVVDSGKWLVESEKPKKTVGQRSLDDESYEQTLRVWNFKRLLSQKYDVVCTNPPYMGSSGMNAKLSEFVKKEYPDSKSDLSTAFMEQTLDMCKPTGYMAMINIPVWMFLSSYEKLRQNIIRSNAFVNMLHFGRGIFGSDFGSTSFVIAKAHRDNYLASYRRLFKKQGAVDGVEQKEKWFFEGMGAFTADSDNFAKIPGSPVAYWVSEKMLQAFIDGQKVSDFADSRMGLTTGDNERFLRFWYEVLRNNIKFDSTSMVDAENSQKKWFPYHKGGEYRKWYGNNDYVINWFNSGEEVCEFKGSTIRNRDYYFRTATTWSLITSSVISFRYRRNGFVFGDAGPAVFAKNINEFVVLGLLNTKIMQIVSSIINPTINSSSGVIANFPVVYNGQNKEDIINIVKQNLSISVADWDSFETSWDFERHPLV
ncbi:hypothetical protein FACS1894167_06840 [Synergistales bacterium]|nr:hypothetical protein FACS1894167_06840 [Synergistales bacterium]